MKGFDQPARRSSMPMPDVSTSRPSRPPGGFHSMPTLLLGLFTAVSLVLGALIPVGGLMAPAEAITINLDIDVSLDRKPISPHIYGLNFAKESFANEIDLPVRRWGGNLLTRYNWQNGMANTAADYYFENLPTTNAFDWSVVETDIGWIGQHRRTGQ